MVQPKIIAVDIDGFLTRGTYWGGPDISEPNRDMIEVVNELALTNFIVINTARRHVWAVQTIDWLRRNGVNFHAIHFDKCPANFYGDDRNVDLKRLLGDEPHIEACEKEEYAGC